MKLATLRTKTRDGQLAVVSRDLQHMRSTGLPCATLQQALDDWATHAPLLQAISEQLNAGVGADGPFDPTHCMAPLPRACQWIDGSASLNHVELVRRARGAGMPEQILTDPLMYQGGSDDFMGPHDAIVAADADYGIDLEAEVVVVTDDVPIGRTPAPALQHIVLVGLVNDATLRNVVLPELAKGFGFLQSKPASALSPVFVTPDELGADWKGGKLHLHLPLRSELNGTWLGAPEAGEDMNFGFDILVAHAACTRRLVAGTIVGSGTVSNRNPEAGVSCLAEKRVREQLDSGAMTTSFLQHGDRVRIEMSDRDGRSIFGAIDQSVQVGSHVSQPVCAGAARV